MTAFAVRIAPVLAILGLAMSPCSAQLSLFVENELRAASLKDQLRLIETTLTDGGKGARKLSLDVTEAFRGVEDWAPAAESFYGRKAELINRAALLIDRLDIAVAAASASENFRALKKTLDEMSKTTESLKADYDFFMHLPAMANTEQRREAQAAMRMLGQTGDYYVTLAFLKSRTPNLPPFMAPRAAGMMPLRPR